MPEDIDRFPLPSVTPEQIAEVASGLAEIIAKGGADIADTGAQKDAYLQSLAMHVVGLMVMYPEIRTLDSAINIVKADWRDYEAQEAMNRAKRIVTNHFSPPSQDTTPTKPLSITSNLLRRIEDITSTRPLT